MEKQYVDIENSGFRSSDIEIMLVFATKIGNCANNYSKI